MATLPELLKTLVDHNGSDLHLTTSTPPQIRVHGKLQTLDLPQLRSTFAQQNSGLGIGIAGLNLLDLRGLGAKRTLVLVNGRRWIGSAQTLDGAVDLNTIPSPMCSCTVGASPQGANHGLP